MVIMIWILKSLICVTIISSPFSFANLGIHPVKPLPSRMTEGKLANYYRSKHVLASQPILVACIRMLEGTNRDRVLD